MQFLQQNGLVGLLVAELIVATCHGQQPVSPATYQQAAQASVADAQAVERIRKIVLHQGDSPRALANLVQLTRDLDPRTAAQLLLDLADDYLRQGKYNQAALFLQQLLNQHHAQPAASAGLLRLMQLYTSSEVNHTQQASSSATNSNSPQSFCKYALHLANNTLQKNKTLNSDPAIMFQRAVTARGANHRSLIKSMHTQLKHNAAARSWRSRVQAEQWLNEDRQGDPPLPTMLCRRASEPPHLDGMLIDPLWQASEAVQLSYDSEFLYLAVRQPKVASATYQADPRPRTHDANLSTHDRVRLRIDLDRDYATCFELAIDHRGWTADRCWTDVSWNPKWFVAAGDNATHWTIEAAIPWDQLTQTPPQAGQAWAIAIDRLLPQSAQASAQSSAAKDFQLLLFE